MNMDAKKGDRRDVFNAATGEVVVIEYAGIDFYTKEEAWIEVSRRQV